MSRRQRHQPGCGWLHKFGPGCRKYPRQTAVQPRCLFRQPTCSRKPASSTNVTAQRSTVVVLQFRRQQNLQIGGLRMINKNLPGHFGGNSYCFGEATGEVPGCGFLVCRGGNRKRGHGPSTQNEKSQAKWVQPTAKARWWTPPPLARSCAAVVAKCHDIATEGRWPPRASSLGHNEIRHMIDPLGEHRRTMRFTFEKRFVASRAAFPTRVFS